MKLLSIAIPCYNSAAYMGNCINSLLPGGDEVEILIVDDGSVKDNTAEIADRYETRVSGNLPGHPPGKRRPRRGCQCGPQECVTGIFFKVVDSDDWVNEAGL